MKNIILAIILIIISSCSIAPKATIPFYINELNRLILSYPINNKNLNMCFDSAIPFNFLDVDVSESINFSKQNGWKAATIYTIGNIPLEVFLYDGEQAYKQDSIFWGAWIKSDMKAVSKTLQLGSNIDGILGYENNFIFEFDFKKHKLVVWDSIPARRLLGKKLKKIKLVDSDFKGSQPYLTERNPICINSELTVMDTLKLHPNLIIDTGNPLYVTIAVYDSILINKLIGFKRSKDALYPTTRLKIPELDIDTAFTSLAVINKSIYNNDGVNPFRNEIGGLIGVSFMRNYNRVIINKKKQIAWFELK